MYYMGGKTRIAKRLVEAILSDTDRRDKWWEPFVGGANVLVHAAPHFAHSVGSDVHEDLILMWQHVTAGGSVPEHVSYDRWRELRSAPPSWERGFAGFGASFGGRWFGGYAHPRPDRDRPIRDSSAEAHRAVMRQAEVFRANRVGFIQLDYVDAIPPAGSIIYCDPPYAGTATYSSTAAFDHGHFYATAQMWAQSCDVYVSEYAIPDTVPAQVIWEKERRVQLKVDDNAATAIERLFKILPA